MLKVRQLCRTYVLLFYIFNCMFLWGAISCLRFEAISKACGGSNLSTVLLLWGIYIKKCISLVRICLQTRNARNASTKFRKTSESKPSERSNSVCAKRNFIGRKPTSLRSTSFAVGNLVHLCPSCGGMMLSERSNDVACKHANDVVSCGHK